MRVRPLVPRDLVQLLPLYAAQVAEESAAQALPYPRATATTTTVASQGLIAALTENAARAMAQAPPTFIGVVAEREDGTMLGYAWGTITERALAAPHQVLRGEVAYVIPAARRHGIARALLTPMWEAAQQAGAEVFEAVYMPGSHGAKVWESAGFRPYRVDAAFVDAAGAPYAHAPLTLSVTAGAA